jgi:hypothetical protein
MDLHVILPKIYLAGLLLPDLNAVPVADETDDQIAARDRLEADDRKEPKDFATTCQLLHDYLGERTWYREVFDPYADSPEVGGGLSDDVSDIYRELRGGLMQWRRDELAEAAWTWRFGLTHWGEHVTSALRALFALSAWYHLPWPQSPQDDP